jgi:hypothetical protein
MFTSLLRAGLFAALVAVACPLALSIPAAAQTAQTAQKPFQREDLADAAIRLEAQIKTDAGLVQKPAGQLRREAEAAFQKNDFRGGLQLLGQAVAAAPEDAGTWLRLSRAVMQIRPSDDRERTHLYERAATAAYIAYRRTTDRNDETDALVIIGKSFSERKVWRPALNALRFALDLRETPDLRVEYERLRDQHGFRMVDYSVDSDSASPRACFQFSETLPGKRTDFSPFVNVAGQDKPAVSADGKQVCVEGLRHGERYSITLRAGLP